ncbi:hypothetical protein [Pseudomonas retamae]|uniref:Uncharacterized protein n=1 Tax=Pseudomonas retamae TaxID=702110 RepID=A0ABW7DHH3_9PSED
MLVDIATTKLDNDSAKSSPHRMKRRLTFPNSEMLMGAAIAAITPGKVISKPASPSVIFRSFATCESKPMGAHSALISTNAPSDTATTDAQDPSEGTDFGALSEEDCILELFGKRLHRL